MQPLRVTGVVASPGYAAGTLFALDRPQAQSTGTGDPESEARRFDDALAQASRDIAALMESTDSDAAAILEVQLALLEDDALSTPVHAAIARSSSATDAWRQTLEAEIAGYEASADDYFRARAADLHDLMDRVLGLLSGVTEITVPAGAILYARDLAPSRFLSLPPLVCVVLSNGSPASHVAMLARARGIPMLVRTDLPPGTHGQPALVDAEAGRVVIHPTAADRATYDASRAHFTAEAVAAQAHLSSPAMTEDGTSIAVLVNIAQPSDVDALSIAHCDGVGLMRSEFLFAGGLPDEDTQVEAYRHVLAWAQGKPVTIRTVDAGGDKPVPGFTIAESNPFLGLRGIRLCLARPDVFRTQIRALLRASDAGNLRVMLPMVTFASELEQARQLFEQEASSLAVPVPPIGIMVEVPAVALSPAAFASAAFFSIGSNDLTQYVLAASRESAEVGALLDPLHPAVLSLVASVTAFGAARTIPVSLCGDVAGDPSAIPSLLLAGLRSLSVAPSQLARIRAAIAGVRLDG